MLPVDIELQWMRSIQSWNTDASALCRHQHVMNMKQLQGIHLVVGVLRRSESIGMATMLTDEFGILQ